MASLFPNKCVQTPVRSISLPSRLHPSSLRAEAELANLRRTWSSSTSSLAAETIQTGLSKLAELFVSMEDLIHNSPLVIRQGRSSHPNHSDKLEEVLEGAVGLLDACSSTRDLLLAMREHVHDLQSALRRKGGDASIGRNLQAYMSFRKKARKGISKSLAGLKKMESSRFGNDHNSLSFVIVDVIREANTIAISILMNCLIFFYQSNSHISGSGWSLVVSKLIKIRSGALGSSDHHHKGHDDEKISINQVESVDIAICSMNGEVRKTGASGFKVGHVKEVQRRLETLDATIRGFESKFDSLFRGLVRHRVSLLNLVTP